jgi:DNA polymerase I
MTEEIYITTTETLYPGDTRYEEVVVRLYGRTRDHETRTITVRGFPPYFYARAAEREKVRPADYEALVGYEEVETDPLSERFDDDPEELVKVIAKYPHEVRNLRQEFDRTWAADTLFTERFRIDSGVKTGVRVPEADRDGHVAVEADEIEPVEMKDVTPRVLTLDIETDDRGAGFPDPGEARILSIAAYDSYQDDYIVFLDLDGDDIPDFFDLPDIARSAWEDGNLGLSDLGLNEPNKLVTKQSEGAMLRTFSAWVRESNPDIITGWNSGDGSNDGFDLPHIIQRMKNLNCGPERLSRESEVEVDDRGDDFKPSITGRACYDLMDGWGDTKFTEPRSFKLDDVAQDKLDDAKIEHPETGYFEMYRDDPVRFVNYNVKDTRLTVEINEEENVLGFKKRLKDMVGVDWRRTHQNNEFIEMSVRRKCREHDISMITAYDNQFVGGDIDEVNYEGAYVFSPFDGLRENVVGIDLESLYPRTQQMLNVSPDARIEKSKALVEGIPFVEAENGQAFRDDVDGIMRELITDYMQLKAEFKQERNNADPGTEEREKLAEVYNVTKTIVNSFYGYGGWNRSPLYNPHDAAAVTLTGQAVIKATAEYVNKETPGEVAYGDTDSVYCSWPDNWGQVRTLKYVNDVCDYLNEELYPNLCEEYRIKPENNRWNMELEKLCTMFMSGSKKRYATNVRWSEGMEFNEVIVQ